MGLKQGCYVSMVILPPPCWRGERPNEKVMERGAALRTGEVECHWKPNQLLFVDDTTLLDDSVKRLKVLVSKFGKMCQRGN